MRYWLFKSEPDTFSIDDLKRNKIDHWDGVRNYQARNFLRDEIKKDDLAFFYHSSCASPGIVGVMKIISNAYPDATAFDPHSNYYDSKSNKDNPRWFLVDVEYVRHTQRNITLSELKAHTQLHELALLKKGNRLSIIPVDEQQWHFILSLESN